MFSSISIISLEEIPFHACAAVVGNLRVFVLAQTFKISISTQQLRFFFPQILRTCFFFFLNSLDLVPFFTPDQILATCGRHSVDFCEKEKNRGQSEQTKTGNDRFFLTTQSQTVPEVTKLTHTEAQS